MEGLNSWKDVSRCMADNISQPWDNMANPYCNQMLSLRQLVDWDGKLVLINPDRTAPFFYIVCDWFIIRYIQFSNQLQ